MNDMINTNESERAAVSSNPEPISRLTVQKQSGLTLRNCVEKVLHEYFTHLEGQSVTNVYDMVLSEVEAPLLKTVMNHVNGNQTKASEVLGLNRGTLRKKLKQYDLL